MKKYNKLYVLVAFLFFSLHAVQAQYSSSSQGLPSKKILDEIILNLDESFKVITRQTDSAAEQNYRHLLSENYLEESYACLIPKFGNDIQTRVEIGGKTDIVKYKLIRLEKVLSKKSRRKQKFIEEEKTYYGVKTYNAMDYRVLDTRLKFGDIKEVVFEHYHPLDSLIDKKVSELEVTYTIREGLDTKQEQDGYRSLFNSLSEAPSKDFDLKLFVFQTIWYENRYKVDVSARIYSEKGITTVKYKYDKESINLDYRTKFGIEKSEALRNPLKDQELKRMETEKGYIITSSLWNIEFKEYEHEFILN